MTFPHVTELEEFTYSCGCVADVYYAAAGGGEQPLRYWLDAAEVVRRLTILDTPYAGAGVRGSGRAHDIDFDAISTLAVVG